MKRFLAAFAFVVTSFCVNAQSAPPILIDVQAPSQKIIVGSEQERLQSSDRSIEWIVPVKVDLAALKGGTVVANLFDETVVITLPSQPSNPGSSTLVWIGHAARSDSTPNSGLDLTNARLYKSANGSLGGNITLGNAIYQLRRLDGKQVLLKRDARVLHGTPDVPLFKERFPLPPKKSSVTPLAQGSAQADVHNTIRVVLAFTNSAVTAAGGLTELQEELTDAISTANAGYAASEIELSLQIAALAYPTYSESSIYASLLDLYYVNGGLWLPHYARNEEYGDVIALVVNTSATEPTMCGQARNRGQSALS
ncbi:hypothetical protein [Pseudoxanthomonas wuyuanensis]|uniref:Uncharacterized protein n=1 Tax=Pseudoxanthomonas wuyuanensis TaxID=1073196 RepID=A0A286DBZ9_9GAMM|nr:hypothetical protein [Pseudoxanthomonas wuyuanensis]SOD56148.1 hypothetical protein SAMN06296416_108199 [Pseudoxanthomonas wuyuanensis]